MACAKILLRASLFALVVVVFDFDHQHEVFNPLILEFPQSRLRRRRYGVSKRINIVIQVEANEEIGIE